MTPNWTVPGPWWDLPSRPAPAALTDAEFAELQQLNEHLEELPDGEVGARHTARNQLTAEQQPRTRLTIARRAAQLLDQRGGPAGLSMIGAAMQPNLARSFFSS